MAYNNEPILGPWGKLGFCYIRNSSAYRVPRLKRHLVFRGLRVSFTLGVVVKGATIRKGLLHLDNCLRTCSGAVPGEKWEA
jgi:hypothetical protein